MPYLNFKGKTAIETYHNSLPHHALEMDAALSVLPDGAGAGLDGNLIIEGDNLIALKSLLPTHAGKVKCIYIDPPYNTGNEGWVYNDNLTQPQFKAWIGQTVGNDETDPTRHDKWCCMMYPRLQLLKELLGEDGAIFISIDDNEVHNLRQLMDEIFGAENFVATIVWQKKQSPQNDAIYLSDMHEYIMLYAKRIKIDASDKVGWIRNLVVRTDKQGKRYSNPDNDPRGVWTSVDYTCNKSADERPNLFYAITNPNTGEEIWPSRSRVWAYEPPTHLLHLKENRIQWRESGGVPRLKRFLAEVKEGTVPTTWWDRNFAGDNQEARREFRSIFKDEFDFATPKPSQLIKRILELATNENDLVLDSFAGSGTTGHATLALNAEDGGNRRFVLVQQKYDSKDNERDGINICESVTAERVRRVINGVNTEPLGGSFTYARVSATPLLGEYRNFGEVLPAYDEIAKYIFYTETSHDFDPVGLNRATGKIGERNGTAYYLFYTPNREEDAEFTLPMLEEIGENDPARSLIVYCEKIWLHRDDRLRWQDATGRSIRTMLVPFHLK